jgi:hypothetical protein
MPVKVESARRILARAAAQVGGIRKLASELDLSERRLRRYILGEEPIPDGLMLQIIDVLLEQLPEPPKTQ